MAKWHNETTDRLIKTIVDLKDSNEAYMFLEDLCTVKEIKEMAQRLQVASLLKQNKSYQADRRNFRRRWSILLSGAKSICPRRCSMR